MPLLIILSSVLRIQYIGSCPNSRKAEKLVAKHIRKKQVHCKAYCALDNHIHFNVHYCYICVNCFFVSTIPRSFLSLWRFCFWDTRSWAAQRITCTYVLSNTWQCMQRPVSMWHLYVAVLFQSLLMMSPDQRRTASQNSFMEEPDEEDIKVKPYTLEEFSYEHFRWSSLCRVLVDQ